MGYFHYLLQMTGFFGDAEDCKVANLVMRGDSRGLINRLYINYQLDALIIIYS